MFSPLLLRRAAAVRAWFLIAALASFAPIAAAQEEDFQPEISEASDEAELAMTGFEVPRDLKIELFAAEPQLANPVAFWINDRGQFYVAETFRLHAGVTDTRGHMNWLDDDLASRTIDDRIAKYRKFLGDEFDSYAGQQDRLRLVWDADADGVADRDTVFAEGFDTHATGIAAGVIEHRGDVYYACIPDLWRLRDADGDGVADEQESLHYGYGVHTGFLGHDLHGLQVGPDGRLYFSIGDRGVNIETPEGRIFYPDEGLVLRCNLDGGDLTVVNRGLRNPQELAFDDYGNLFTGDNNSDGGDQARWVYLVEGSDSGWRMGYQYMSNRGPWNDELLWKPREENTAAYLVPPIANLGDGPSGLTYYPGTGLPERFCEHFFLADFRGAPATSGIRTFRVEPRGAGFSLADSEQFVWRTLPTDVDFGPDGALYFTDWVNGWGMPTKGRIYRILDPAQYGGDAARDVQALIAADLSDRSIEDLVALLHHADRRVRQKAQFALADHGEHAKPALVALATTESEPNDHAALLARLHAIWALGQLGRDGVEVVAPLAEVVSTSNDPRLVGQASKILGEVGALDEAAVAALVGALQGDAYAASLAAISLGHVGAESAVDALFALADRAGASDDPVLRHAAAVGLAGCASVEALAAAANRENPRERLAALLALRRLRDPGVAAFLSDEDSLVSLEAARAISGEFIAAALPELAAHCGDSDRDFAFMRRALNAALHVRDAAAVASAAANKELDRTTRLEALEILGDWEAPSGRDRVVGLWRPIEQRPADEAAAALRPVLADLLAADDEIAEAAFAAMGGLELQGFSESLEGIARDEQRIPRLRAAALRTLGQTDLVAASRAAAELRDTNSALVRRTANQLLAEADPSLALDIVRRGVASDDLAEAQAAFALLGRTTADGAADLALAQLSDIQQLNPALQLDALLAAELRPEAEVSRAAAALRDLLTSAEHPHALYDFCLNGGDAKRGESIFFDRTDVSCQRCHRVGERGGAVGPELTTIARDKDAAYLLKSIVDPNAVIAKGFETTILVLSDGRVVTGIVQEEDDDRITLVTAEAETKIVPKDDIEDRVVGQSAMPTDVVEKLSLADLRDLIAYLSARK